LFECRLGVPHLRGVQSIQRARTAGVAICIHAMNLNK
jgi:hypothetical protein